MSSFICGTDLALSGTSEGTGIIWEVDRHAKVTENRDTGVRFCTACDMWIAYNNVPHPLPIMHVMTSDAGTYADMYVLYCSYLRSLKGSNIHLCSHLNWWTTYVHTDCVDVCVLFVLLLADITVEGPHVRKAAKLMKMHTSPITAITTVDSYVCMCDQR